MPISSKSMLTQGEPTLDWRVELDTLILSGELTTKTLPKIYNAKILNDSVDNRAEIRSIDASDLAQIDSAGLAFLTCLAVKQQSRGRIDAIRVKGSKIGLTGLIKVYGLAAFLSIDE